jgi:hypothetical protein
MTRTDSGEVAGGPNERVIGAIEFGLAELAGGVEPKPLFDRFVAPVLPGLPAEAGCPNGSMPAFDDEGIAGGLTAVEFAGHPEPVAELVAG